MGRFVDFTLGGISIGMIYALVALSLVLIWRSTRIVNFAQGGMAMFTTFIALTVIDATGSFWAGFAVALASGLVLGAVIERFVMRRVEGGPELNAVIVALGVLVLLQASAAIIWGGEFKSFPSPFSIEGISIAGNRVALSPNDLFIIGVVLALMAALTVLFTRTSVGLQMRAAAFQPEVARLLGVRVGRMLTLGWALAALAGSLAGVLVAPSVLLHPNSLDAVLVFGFAAAVLGGLDSPVGAVLGGLLMGLALNYIGGYGGSSVVALGALAILVTVLMVRPQGLMGRSALRRV